MSIRRKIATATVGVAALGLAAVGLGAAPASASPGGCVWGTDACLYYHSNFSGGYNGDGGNDNYFPAWTFAGCSGSPVNCDGDNQQVVNNIGAVWNMTGRTVTIYQWWNCSPGGPYLPIPAYTQRTLYGTAVYNSDQSQCFS
ncbi:hypothetical protein ACIRVF_03570 [Kitasatospora sp. NPDC101157]|uniref:hypothetical protein n=1 Tax=Kitasatospora sp. NPDC101157 TaxID=3364098 RepID=UPI003828A9EC